MKNEMEKPVYAGIHHSGITLEMICIETLHTRIMEALKTGDTAKAVEAHKDVLRSLIQIKRYQTAERVEKLKASSKIVSVEYPEPLKKMKGLI